MRKLTLVSLAVYLFFLGGYLNNVMLNSISALTIALVEDKSTIIDPYHGASNDISFKDGHYYSGMPPGLSFMLVPVYALEKVLLLAVPDSWEDKISDRINEKLSQQHSHLGQAEKRFAMVLLQILGVILLAIPLMLYCAWKAREVFSSLEVPQGNAFTAILLLLSPLAAFTPSLWHTTIAAFFLSIAFCLAVLHRKKEASLGTTALIGLLLGSIGTLDYPALVYALLVGVYFMFTRPRALLVKSSGFAIGFAILPLFLMSFYHYASFGSWLTSSYQWRIDSHLYSVLRAEVAAKGTFTFLPNLTKVIRTFIDSRCGILFFHPAILIALPCLAWHLMQGRRDRDLSLVCLLLIGANLFYFSSLPESVNPAAGSFGARYTIYSTLFALIAIGIFLRDKKWQISPLWILAVAFLLHLPNWMYWLYGAPVRSSGEYLELLSLIGPTNYTLSKLFQAGILNSPWLSWGIFCVFLLLLGVLFKKGEQK